MLDIDALRAAANRLAAAASSPSRVIVFGSYARGTADSDSDLDLVVIEQEISNKEGEYLRLRSALGRIAPGVGVDLLIFPLDEFERRRLVPGTIPYEASLEGKVLYDALH